MDPDHRNLLIRARALLTGVAGEDDAEPRAGVARRLRADIHAALERDRIAPAPAGGEMAALERVGAT